MGISISLPRKYEYIEGVTNPEYKKFHGYEKISVSQYTGFLSDNYCGGYISHYFENIPRESNIFSEFGTMVGEYLDESNHKVHPYLDERDFEVLDAIMDDYVGDEIFEYEIVIDLKPFGLNNTCIQGFIDKLRIDGNNIIISDFKTGNIDREAMYASEDYVQTDVYGYYFEVQNPKNIITTSVDLIGRKGNALDRTAMHFNGKTPMDLRLSGEVISIPREYTSKRAKKIMQDIADTCIVISDYYAVYNEYLKED